MAKIVASAEGTVDAPANTVYGYIADMREHHPQFLPPAFSDFRVESGGVGAGTVTRFKLTAGGRTREYRTVVAEPEPGRILTEFDTNSSAITTFTVSPQGAASLVRSRGMTTDSSAADSDPEHRPFGQATSRTRHSSA